MTNPINKIPNDKRGHAIAGVIVWILSIMALHIASGYGYPAPYNKEIALGATIVAGAGKEVWDSLGHGHVEFMDFVATISLPIGLYLI